MTYHMSQSKNLMLCATEQSICAIFISRFPKTQTTDEDGRPFL